MAAARLPELGAPEIISICKRSVTLEWTSPGFPIKKYKLRYARRNCSNKNGKTITIEPTTTTHTVDDLRGGPKEYEFRVAAVTRDGPGPFSDPGILCSSCEAIHGQEQAIMRLKGNLEDALKKPKTLTQFLKYANALLNSRAGNIVIHSSDHNLLEKFDQKVDPKLKDLISDGTLYHNVFERSYFDPYHLVYRVKPSAGLRVWSTLDFKSKVSYNKGIEQPSHRNMSVCIDTLCATSPDLGGHRQTQEKLVFELGEEVVVWKKKEQNEEEVEVFQESMTLQAKAIHIQAEREPDYGLLRLKLANHCWNSLKLKEYITAFTKIRGGGSIFLGVSEHKTRQVAWEIPDPNIVNGPFTVAGEQWGVWQEKNGPDPPILYHLAREAKTNEQATGQFITDAFQLTDYEKKKFKDDILKRVGTLKWIGRTDHSGVVQVDFHDVNINGNHGDGCCVIEIRINYYHGLCFYDTEGPESYRCRPPLQGSIFQSQPELERIQVNEWIKSFKSKGDEHMEELKNLPRDQREGLCFFCFSML